jgi:hypothetical protein
MAAMQKSGGSIFVVNKYNVLKNSVTEDGVVCVC